MLKGTVIRNNAIWQGHPDVAHFNDELFVVFRESDRHTTRSETRIMITSKTKRTSFSKPKVIATSEQRFNCPRLSVIDDTMWIICDEIKHGASYVGAENTEEGTRILLWKTTDGVAWEGPIETNITGIVPDKICATDKGFMIATHIFNAFDPTVVADDEEPALPVYSKEQALGNLVQNVWHASELDGHWTKHPLCHVEERNMCEGSICRFGHTYLCLMRENSGLGLPAHIVYSRDGFEWSKPLPTRMFGAHRPVTGVLQSGNLLTTYREASHSFKPGFWAKNTFACLTIKHSVLKDLTDSIILPLDHDKNKSSDSGYTGWVQLPDKSIFIVNYVTDDAPRPYIRWYQIREDDF